MIDCMICYLIESDADGNIYRFNGGVLCKNESMKSAQCKRIYWGPSFEVRPNPYDYHTHRCDGSYWYVIQCIIVTI